VDAELRGELLRRVAADQQARVAADFDAVRRADDDNLPWLRQLVAGTGWPGRSVVGEDGAHAAWLLAQHADRDPELQRHCLDLLTAAVRDGEASPEDLVYLTDRVRLAHGEPQEYGTQMHGTPDGWVPGNLRDPGQVDERRAAAGLGPLAGYVARFADHAAPEPASLSCPGCRAEVQFWPPAGHGQVEAHCTACGRDTTVTIGPPPPGVTG
jgi:hypothetical protein